MMEFFEIVNEHGEVIGRASRAECHKNPALIHRAAHVLVFNHRGELLMQLRSKDKDTYPGRWDSSVGGHLGIGETYEQAAARETKEELGIEPPELKYLYEYALRDGNESEIIRSFMAVHDGPFSPQPEEIDEVRFWTEGEIRSSLGKGIFTPHFEREYELYTNLSPLPSPPPQRGEGA